MSIITVHHHFRREDDVVHTAETMLYQEAPDFL